MTPITTLLDRLESTYGFRDDHGHPLKNCEEWMELRARIKGLSNDIDAAIERVERQAASATDEWVQFARDAEKFAGKGVKEGQWYVATVQFKREGDSLFVGPASCAERPRSLIYGPDLKLPSRS